ncbi:ATP-binding cassette domain-containing protein [Acetobacterium paludosum]|uniref:ATP-binding cassette domain-containing protein n=1 Tax=Acetobacterium paludosum TaxID=52693 RepID=A0A923KY19_9FIRM|nr:ABC transporter ATP-binding protein [Acetobacterium paludosum]MBC3889086.1 ATP-binding cassette domain-containing protein [Acetobacterium paludosum]
MRRSQKFEKPKNRKGTLMQLGGYLMRYKWRLLLAILLTIGSNLLALVGPLLSGYAIDAIELGVGQVNFSRVFYFAFWMVGFYLASAGLSYGLEVLMITISRKVTYAMRKDVFNKLLDLPIGYFDVHQTGDVISRITYDIDTVNSSLSDDLVQVSSAVITVLGSFLMMLAISPKLVLIFVVTVPLSLLMSKYLVKKTRPLFSRRSGKLGKLNGFVEEMVSGQRTLKVYDQEESTIKRFDIRNKEAVEAYYNAEYYGSMIFPMVNFINNISLSFISVFGALLYLAGEMTIGKISSFVLYSRKFAGPINEMANIMSDLQSALAAAERVFDLLNELSEAPDAKEAVPLANIRGDIELCHVKFGYDSQQRIINDLSLKVKAGELIAIVGETGAGKTTIINLLMRFYDADAGQIYIDGKEVHEVTRDSLRKAYAMVLQDTWIFYGSIYENLTYGKENATMAEVVAAAKAARIHSFITHLPDGYGTILSDEGANISKGQKQLLSIARAMLLEAKILILDEATSNVDTRTEKKIQEAMRNLMKDKTCFVIAHRLSTIQNADHILVVDRGEIVETGTHQELMRMTGRYWQLYQAQFE